MGRGTDKGIEIHVEEGAVEETLPLCFSSLPADWNCETESPRENKRGLIQLFSVTEFPSAVTQRLAGVSGVGLVMFHLPARLRLQRHSGANVPSWSHTGSERCNLVFKLFSKINTCALFPA